MCGIFGYINFAEEKVNYNLEDALDYLKHRGPDEKGFWSENGIFLGIRRLSIIDLAGGQQPIWNEDGTTCIVYNGELYNFMDLRPELESRGHKFKSKSDTEVVLHSFEEWGPKCLCRFNGMFAFAIWDNRERTLFLARDRIGEKPLYYYHDKEKIIFASEIKAILATSEVLRQLNLRGLANFLAFGHAVAPETILKNIYKLLPGHYLSVSKEHFRITSYWDVGDNPQLPVGAQLSEQEYSEHILNLLDDSVRRRMIADVPVGAFLSGGVDSSAVVALMKRHGSGPVKTFSLGFDVGGAYNELADARRVANHLGTEHYELKVNDLDLVNLLSKLIYHYDEPFGDAAGFPIFILSCFAREHVKVVLAGDGGDELFGGYRRYVADRFASTYQKLPNWLIGKVIPSIINKIPRFRRLKTIFKTLPIIDPAARYASWLQIFSKDMQAELFTSHFWEELNDYDPVWIYPHYFKKSDKICTNDNLNRLLYIDLKTWLPDTYMEKVDKATMACSLEARLPLLDHRLVEMAFQIPGYYKIQGISTKKIIKRAVKGLLPKSVLKKPKHGFAVPTDPWFRGKLKSFAFEVLMDDKTLQRGFFNRNVVERLWQEHVNGRNVWNNHLWLLLNFELWQRIYIDQENHKKS
ncbi:MAG: asparagine synthase (glutamine-hydrolyzing) [Desulfobaccales bacterium]